MAETSSIDRTRAQKRLVKLARSGAAAWNEWQGVRLERVSSGEWRDDPEDPNTEIKDCTWTVVAPDKQAKSHDGENDPDASTGAQKFVSGVDVTDLDPDNVDFSNCCFDSDISFDRFIFRGAVTFNKAKFKGNVSFDHAVFMGDRGLRDRMGLETSAIEVFGDRNFAILCRRRKPTPSDPASRYEQRFVSNPRRLPDQPRDFDRGLDLAHLTHNTRVAFSDARFEGWASFRMAWFFDGASFDGARFARGASFENARFDLFADFHGVKFMAKSGFSESDFDEKRLAMTAERFEHWAVFKGATFSWRVDFRNARFGGWCSFERSVFHNRAYFSNCVWREGAYFDNARFHQPPRFYDAKLHSNTSFQDADFGPAQAWSLCSKRNQKQRDESIRSWQRLKEEMNRLQRHQDEHEHFAREMAVKKQSLKEQQGCSRWWQWAMYKLYEMVSDYGRSALRPLTSMVGFLIFGMLIFFAMSLLSKPVNWTTSEIFARLGTSISITFSSAIPGVSGALEKSGEAQLEHLYCPNAMAGGNQISSCYANDIPFWPQLLFFFLQFVNVIFLFLIGLAIRNRFRIR